MVGRASLLGIAIAGGALMTLVLTGPTEPTQPIEPSHGVALKWRPPVLEHPITINLGTGYTHTVLSPTRDYIINLPTTPKIGGTALEGGHNIVMIGGSITIPAGTEPGTANDAQRRGIYIKGATGTVHIEGVSIQAFEGVEYDGVDTNAPEATVQLENLRIIGVRGRHGFFHGDVVQPWGGVKLLRIDHLTGTSNYQGLFLQEELGPIGSVEIDDVDLTATTEPPLEGGGHMLWLGNKSDPCSDFPATLEDVYVKPRPERTLGTSVWPQDNQALCPEQGMAFATWPDLPITGGVDEGVPAAGNFVPPGAAGIGYRSPGYAD
jgi:hypothetical protein